MGQYFRSVLKQNNKVTVYNGNVDNQYTMAKLMEHSWWENELLKAIGNKLYKTKGQLAWVGDYAEDDELKKITNGKLSCNKVWSDKKAIGLNKSGFSFDGKYLCNHTKKCYINLDEYYDKNVFDGGWCINPLSLLTAIGNGRGGGDYRGVNEDLVGSWAWDVLSIEDEYPTEYSEFAIWFSEE